MLSNQNLGFFTDAQCVCCDGMCFLSAHHASGYLPLETLVWKEGLAEWVPLSSLGDLVASPVQPASRLPSAAAEEKNVEATAHVSSNRSGSRATAAAEGAGTPIKAPADEDDDYRRWKEEIRKAEEEAEALKRGTVRKADVAELSSSQDEGAEAGASALDERPQSPPEGEEEFTDDDGTSYKWDKTMRAWVPQVLVKIHLHNFIPSGSIQHMFP